MQAVTDFGDLAVTLPVAALLLAAFALSGNGRAALRFGLALLLCMAATAAGKLLFLACGPHWGLSLESPSGHTSMGVLVYGAWAHALGEGRSPRVRAGLWAAATLTAGGIALTRITLAAHTVPDVLLGGLIGGLALVIAAARPESQPAGPKIRAAVAAGLALMVFAVHGAQFSVEPHLREPALLGPLRAVLCGV